MKNSSRPRSRNAGTLPNLAEFVDHASRCCRNISAITRLLERGDCGKQAESVDSTLVADAAGIIQQEIGKLRNLLNEL